MTDQIAKNDDEDETIFNDGDMVKMAVIYMLPDHFDVEKIQEKAKSLGEGAVLSQQCLVKEFLDSSKRCRIYGSSEQFVEQLTEFQNFPASHKFFPLKFTTPYYTTPVLYKSLSGERFFCKQDFHTILQYLVRDTVPASKSHVISSLISIFLKSKEETIKNGKIGFRRFEMSEFEAIRDELSTTNYTYYDAKNALKSTFFNGEILEKLRADFSKLLDENSAENPENSEKFDDEITGKFLKLIPTTTWSVDETQWITKALREEKISAGNSKNAIIETLIWLYTNASLILKKLEKIVEKWAELMTETTTVIRVFEDNDQKHQRFCLKTEIFEALKIEKSESLKDFDNTKFVKNPMKIRKIKPKSKIKNLLTVPPATTDFAYGLLYEEAVKKYKNSIENAENPPIFVRFPLKRTPKCVQPVLGPPEKCGHHQFYVPAVDAMLEILKALIWGARVFQKFETDKKKVIYEIFTDLATVFDAEMTTPTLLRHLRQRELTSSFVKKCSFHKKTSILDIRDVTDGQEFTLEELKIELKNLELLDFFGPKILDFAEAVFADISSPSDEAYRKSPRIWFDAVENCQLCSIMDHFPKLKSFLHAQQSCHQIVGLQCSTCPPRLLEFSRNSESQNSNAVEKFPDVGKCRISPKSLKRSAEFEEAILFEDVADSEVPEIFEDAPEEEDVVKISISSTAESGQKKLTVILNAEDVISKNVNSKNSEDVECQTEHDYDENREEEMKTLRTIIEKSTIHIGTINDYTKTQQTLIDAYKRESTLQAKKSDSRVKQLEKDLNREEEKVMKYKKRCLEMSDLARENGQMKTRIYEMEEAETRWKADMENKTAYQTQKLAARDSKIDQLERELKKSQDRNEALKNIFSTNSHLTEENEKLKIRISGCETREKRITDAYEKMKKTFNEDRVKFSERIAEMARNLRSEKMKTSEVELTASQLRKQLRSMQNSDSIVEINNLKEDIVEKKRYIQLILETNAKLNAEVKRNERKLLKISEVLEGHTPLTPSSTTTRNHGKGAESKSGRSQLNLNNLAQYEPPPPPKFLPIGAERCNDSSRRLNSITPSTSTSSSSAASHFVFTPPPPGLTLNPSEFSSRLLIVEPSELADAECVICLSEVCSTDKKIIKCHECRRRFHGKCASDWLKVKSICPTCKGKLLDPDEFPAL